jgi:hypothetical protein
MSWQPADDPKPGDRFSCDAIETMIVPRSRDLGSFEVRRALPSSQRQRVSQSTRLRLAGARDYGTRAGAFNYLAGKIRRKNSSPHYLVRNRLRAAAGACSGRSKHHQSTETFNA